MDQSITRNLATVFAILNRDVIEPVYNLVAYTLAGSILIFSVITIFTKYVITIYIVAVSLNIMIKIFFFCCISCIISKHISSSYDTADILHTGDLTIVFKISERVILFLKIICTVSCPRNTAENTSDISLTIYKCYACLVLSEVFLRKVVNITKLKVVQSAEVVTGETTNHICIYKSQFVTILVILKKLHTDDLMSIQSKVLDGT